MRDCVHVVCPKCEADCRFEPDAQLGSGIKCTNCGEEIVLGVEDRSLSADRDSFTRRLARLVQRNKGPRAAVAVAAAIILIVTVVVVLRPRSGLDRPAAKATQPIAERMAARKGRHEQRVAASAAELPWRSPNRYRLLLQVDCRGVSRSNSPASVDVDFARILSDNGIRGTFDEHTIEVIAYDGLGAAKAYDVTRAGYERHLLPWRLEKYYPITKATLHFVVPEEACRTVAVYFDTVPATSIASATWTATGTWISS